MSGTVYWTYPILPFENVACAQNSCIQRGWGELLPIHSLKWIQTIFSKVAKRSSRVLPADLCTDHAHYAKNKRSTVFEKKQKHGGRRRDCFSVLYLLILSMSLFSVWFFNLSMSSSGETCPARVGLRIYTAAVTLACVVQFQYQRTNAICEKSKEETRSLILKKQRFRI